VHKKVACPFLGSAVHQKFLAVRGDADNPLPALRMSDGWATAEAAISAIFL
jgi:hypothetical protein